MEHEAGELPTVIAKLDIRRDQHYSLKSLLFTFSGSFGQWWFWSVPGSYPFTPSADSKAGTSLVLPGQGGFLGLYQSRD